MTIKHGFNSLKLEGSGDYDVKALPVIFAAIYVVYSTNISISV